MKKLLLIFGIIGAFTLHLNAANIAGEQLAKDLELNPNKKVISQWKKVFQDEKRLKRYGINQLTKEEQIALKQYLITHAKDSNKEEGF